MTAYGQRPEAVVSDERSFAGVAYVGNRFSKFVLCRKFRHHQEFTITSDNRQQVVEVMSHTTSQPANGLHFLSLKELRLQSLSFGDVSQNAGKSFLTIEYKL